jgi:hypothetical protein
MAYVIMEQVRGWKAEWWGRALECELAVTCNLAVAVMGKKLTMGRCARICCLDGVYILLRSLADVSALDPFLASAPSQCSRRPPRPSRSPFVLDKPQAAPADILLLRPTYSAAALTVHVQKAAI